MKTNVLTPEGGESWAVLWLLGVCYSDYKTQPAQHWFENNLLSFRRLTKHTPFTPT